MGYICVACVSKSLNKFPVGGGRIVRLCSREFKIPEMDL